MARLRGDIEAYQADLKSTRAELQKRDKSTRINETGTKQISAELKEALRKIEQVTHEKDSAAENHQNEIATLLRQRNDAQQKIASLLRQVSQLNEKVDDVDAQRAQAVDAMLSLNKKRGLSSTMFTQTMITQADNIFPDGKQRNSNGKAPAPPTGPTRGTQTVSSHLAAENEELIKAKMAAQELRDELAAEQRMVNVLEGREASLRGQLQSVEIELSNRDEAEVTLKTQLLRADHALRIERQEQERHAKEKLANLVAQGTQATPEADERAASLQEELLLWRQKCLEAEDEADDMAEELAATRQHLEKLEAEHDSLRSRCEETEKRLGTAMQSDAEKNAQLEQLRAAEAAHQQQLQQRAVQAQVFDSQHSNPTSATRRIAPPQALAQQLQHQQPSMQSPQRVVNVPLAPPTQRQQSQQPSSPAARDPPPTSTSNPRAHPMTAAILDNDGSPPSITKPMKRIVPSSPPPTTGSPAPMSALSPPQAAVSQPRGPSTSVASTGNVGTPPQSVPMRGGPPTAGVPVFSAKNLPPGVALVKGMPGKVPPMMKVNMGAAPPAQPVSVPVTREASVPGRERSVGTAAAVGSPQQSFEQYMKSEGGARIVVPAAPHSALSAPTAMAPLQLPPHRRASSASQS